jgi:parallel beta-helix repeat protein
VQSSTGNNLLGLTIENAADHGVHFVDSDNNALAERYGAFCNAIKTTVKNSYRENIFVEDSDNNVIQNVESAYPTPNSCASSGACVGAWIENSDGTVVQASAFADKGIIIVGDSSWNHIGASGTANVVTAPRLEFRNRVAGTPSDNFVTNVTITATSSSNCIVFKNPRLCFGGPEDGESCVQDGDCPEGTCERPTVLAESNTIRTPVTLTNCSQEIEAESRECVGGSNAGADCSGNGDCTGGGTCQTYGASPETGDENRLCAATCSDGTCNKSDPNGIVTISASDCP